MKLALSEMQLEPQEDVRTTGVEPAEEEPQAQEESIATPLNDEILREIPEGVNDEPQEKEEEVIESCAGLGNTLFYLQARTVQVLDEKVEKFVSGVEEESALAERPPPVIDQPDGYHGEEGPELKDERPKRRAARLIYWVQLEPWPESLKVRDPPDHGLHPKEKRKVQETYKNHKKKRAVLMKMRLRKGRWTGSTAKRKVMSGPPVKDSSHKGLPTSELIMLKGNSEPLDPVNCKGGNGNRRMDDCEEGRKLPTHKHRGTEMINWAETQIKLR